MTATISIKGIRDGLLLTVRGATDWDTAEDAILARIDQTADFFRGARVALELGDLQAEQDGLARLRETLSDRRVTLWAILGENEATAAAAQSLGLNVALPTTSPDRPKTADEDVEVSNEETGVEALLVKRTLRSGRTVRHNGDVVVFGDVNAGAEIIAAGDILVWGRLRGIAHAGAFGDERCVVGALDLAPTQLRIAGKIATAPARDTNPQPELARIRDGHIMAERWNRR